MAASLFLDTLSTTPLSEESSRAMEQFRQSVPGISSEAHSGGARARQFLNEARKSFQSFFKAASPEEILFTSSGTEAANLAIKGTAWASASAGKKHLVISRIEHPAVEESVCFLEAQGFTATRVEVDGEGKIAPESIRDAIREDTCLVATHLANYDIGTVQPVAEIASWCRQRSVPLFCDASTSGGWLPVEVGKWGVDLLSLAPHRFYGPAGVGVLYRRKGLKLEPLIHGGRQEFQLRAGTENLEGIVGAGAAALLASKDEGSRTEKCRSRQLLFLERLGKNSTHWKLNGPGPGPLRDPHHLSISFQHVEAEALALRLDLRGIQVGAGTGCRSRNLKISPVLQLLGVSKEWSLGTLLIGLSQNLTEEEVERAVDEISTAVTKLRAMSPAWEKEN